MRGTVVRQHVDSRHDGAAGLKTNQLSFGTGHVGTLAISKRSQLYPGTTPDNSLVTSNGQYRHKHGTRIVQILFQRQVLTHRVQNIVGQ
jgi:hypothetical protein